MKIKTMIKRMGIVAPCFLVFNENLEAWWWTLAGLCWWIGLVVAANWRPRRCGKDAIPALRAGH